MNDEIQLEHARVFFGDVTSHGAKVYAQMGASLLPKELELTGSVSGPHCDSSRMLPATMPLRYLGCDPSPLAMTTVPDPTLWSPELPARYLITLQAKRKGRVVAEETRLLGIRHFAALNRSFVNDGRRTVIRAATPNESFARQSSPWRASMMHQLVRYEPLGSADRGAQQWFGAPLYVADDDHLEFASSEGVPMLAVVAPADLAGLVEQLRALERHASVRVVIVPSEVVELLEHDAHAREAVRRAKGNLVLVGCVTTGLDSEADEAALAAKPNEAIAGFAVPAEGLSRIEAGLRSSPLIAMQSIQGSAQATVEELRGQCEAIQQELTRYGDFAGYVALQT